MVAMILHFTSVAQNESNESICTLFINNVILQKLGFTFGLQMACHQVQPNTFLFPNQIFTKKLNSNFLYFNRRNVLTSVK